jgi:hypothetical protein
MHNLRAHEFLSWVFLSDCSSFVQVCLFVHGVPSVMVSYSMDNIVDMNSYEVEHDVFVDYAFNFRFSMNIARGRVTMGKIWRSNS